MATRDIYLKIETIPHHSPVAPNPHVRPLREYKRECMRNIVYREYLDANYFVLKPDKLALADGNEPSYQRRVPNAMIYSRPDERLRIHIKNADREPHSFHVHGLRYGIECEGSWPLGVQALDGRRSDEIWPGRSGTYTCRADEAPRGHARVQRESALRGLRVHRWSGGLARNRARRRDGGSARLVPAVHRRHQSRTLRGTLVGCRRDNPAPRRGDLTGNR